MTPEALSSGRGSGASTGVVRIDAIFSYVVMSKSEG